MKAPASVWEDAWPLGEAGVWAEGSILVLLCWRLGEEGCAEGVGSLRDFAHSLWSNPVTLASIYLVLAHHRLSFSVLCLRWAIFKAWCGSEAVHCYLADLDSCSWP